MPTERPDLSAHIPGLLVGVPARLYPWCACCTRSYTDCTRRCILRCTRCARSHAQSMPMYPLRPLKYPIYPIKHPLYLLVYALYKLTHWLYRWRSTLYPLPYRLYPPRPYNSYDGCTRRCTRSTHSCTRSAPIYPLRPPKYPIYSCVYALQAVAYPLYPTKHWFNRWRTCSTHSYNGCTRWRTRRTRSHTRSMPIYPL